MQKEIPRMFSNILVPLDGSVLSERALPYAVELADAAGAHLTLVRASRMHHDLHTGLQDERPREAADYLFVQANRLHGESVPIETAVAPGEPPEALLDEIERRQPDLVVMSTHGRSGLGRWVYGSVTEAVLGRCGRPVLLVRGWTDDDSDRSYMRGKRVLMPLDGSEFAESALPTAVQLTNVLGTTLLLVQAINWPGSLVHASEMERVVPSYDPMLWLSDAEDEARNYLRCVADRLATSATRVRVSTLARMGPLPALIRELATGPGSPIGLVVMATHDRTGLEQFTLGSDADAVLRGDDLPLVLVRPAHAGFAPEEACTTGSASNAPRGQV